MASKEDIYRDALKEIFIQTVHNDLYPSTMRVIENKIRKTLDAKILAPFELTPEQRRDKGKIPPRI